MYNAFMLHLLVQLKIFSSFTLMFTFVTVKTFTLMLGFLVSVHLGSPFSLVVTLVTTFQDSLAESRDGREQGREGRQGAEQVGGQIRAGGKSKNQNPVMCLAGWGRARTAEGGQGQGAGG